jgi:hypothetical protein
MSEKLQHSCRSGILIEGQRWVVPCTFPSAYIRNSCSSELVRSKTFIAHHSSPTPRRRPQHFGTVRSVRIRNPMRPIDFSERYAPGFRHNVRDQFGLDRRSGGTPEKRLGFFVFLARP